MATRVGGRPGNLRTGLIANEKALFFLKKSVRNRFVRGALVHAGDRWIGGFLPKRFTDYVKRQPFGYREHSVKGLTKKTRRMGLLQEMLNQYLAGWDPWSAEQPPQSRFLVWLKTEQAGGRHRWSAGGFWRSARREFRVWAQKMIESKVEALRDRVTPLVSTGRLRDMALANATARATVTGKRETLTVTIPRPVDVKTGKNGRQRIVVRGSDIVLRCLTLIPSWENQFVAAQFKEALTESLKDGKPLPGGLPARRRRPAKPRDTGQAPARS